MLTTEGIIVRFSISLFSLSQSVVVSYYLCKRKQRVRRIKKPQFWDHKSSLLHLWFIPLLPARHQPPYFFSLRQNPSLKMTSKSKILFIGGTGYIGKYIVEASARSGHPTLVLVRNSTLTSPSRSSTIENFKNLGVQFLLVRIYLFTLFSFLWSSVQMFTSMV